MTRKREISPLVEDYPQSGTTLTSEASSYGLLVITHAYNEGKITFHEWLEQSEAWARQIIAQYGQKKAA